MPPACSCAVLNCKSWGMCAIFYVSKILEKKLQRSNADVDAWHADTTDRQYAVAATHRGGAPPCAASHRTAAALMANKMALRCHRDRTTVVGKRHQGDTNLCYSIRVHKRAEDTHWERTGREMPPSPNPSPSPHIMGSKQQDKQQEKAKNLGRGSGPKATGPGRR